LTLSKSQKGQKADGTLSFHKVDVLLSGGSAGLVGIEALFVVFFSFVVANDALIRHNT